MEILHKQRVLHNAPPLPLGESRGFRAVGQQKGRMLEFAEFALGFPLEEKQRELLQGARRRVILNCTRQWGKSWMAAVAVLFHALQHPGTTIVLAGPGLRQSGELLMKVRALARRMGLACKGDAVNRQSAVLPNLSRIVAVPAVADLIVGLSDVTMLVIDEAAMVKDEIYFVIRPMLTQKNGTIWLISTPRGKRGFYYRAWAEGSEEWQRVEVPATACPRFTPEQLAEEKSAMGAKLFAREFLCEFVEVEDGMFSDAWFENVFMQGVKPLEGLW